jgi:N-methylhydantoinase A
MRYVGQGHEVSVTLPDGVLSAAHSAQISAAFAATYRGLYSREGPDVALEVINWRVVASGPRPETTFNLVRDSSRQTEIRKEFRRAYFPEREGYVETPVYDRYALKPGMQFAGPAIVEERESTLIVGAGGRARVDDFLNIIVELSDDI